MAAIERHVLGACGAGADGDSELLGGDALRFSRSCHLNQIRLQEASLPPHQVNAVAVEGVADDVQFIIDDLAADGGEVGDGDVPLDAVALAIGRRHDSLGFPESTIKPLSAPTRAFALGPIGATSRCALGTGVGPMEMTTMSTEFGPMHTVLAASGRSPDIPEAMDLYGWLVGSWELDVVGCR